MSQTKTPFDLISERAKADAVGYAKAHGEPAQPGHQAAMLRMYLIEMDKHNLTPAQFVRYQGWDQNLSDKHADAES